MDTFKKKKKTKTIASSSITSWQIDGERIETVTEFILLGSKITMDGDCSHEIKMLGRKAMTNLDSILKSRDMTLLIKFYIVKAVVFLVVMYGCESWTIKKAEHRRIDAFRLWCWRRLLRVPWTSRRSVQFNSIAQSCLALCNPMDTSMPGFPVYHQLPELAQTHMSIESVMPSDHLILSHPLLLLPSVCPSIRVFSSESVLRIR